MKKIIILVVLGAATIFANAQTTRYVVVGGAGNEDGSSWTDASGDLQDMINQSDSGDVIWVAAGRYKPKRQADNLSNIDTLHRDNAFVLKKGVKIYGGFAGNETRLAQRNWTTNVTELYGLFRKPNTIYAYHIVVSVGDVGDACLDGFTITQSKNETSDMTKIMVDGVSVCRGYGGGIALYNSSPLLANLTIMYNNSIEGGGLYLNNSNPVIVNTLICHNYGYNNGGGIKCVNSTPSVINAKQFITENHESR